MLDLFNWQRGNFACPQEKFTFAVHFFQASTMAQHASSKKRIRQTEGLREDNRYYKKSTRTAIKKLREMTTKSEAAPFLPKVVGMIDRLVRRNSWHKNKAANLKSSLTKFVAGLS